MSEGLDSVGSVMMRIENGGRVFSGRGASTDIIVASAQAYLSAVNRMLGRRRGGGIAGGRGRRRIRPGIPLIEGFSPLSRAERGFGSGSGGALANRRAFADVDNPEVARPTCLGIDVLRYQLGAFAGRYFIGMRNRMMP